MSQSIIDEYKNINIAIKFTNEKLKNIRTKLDEKLSTSNQADNITIIATGSYGRGEASDESDLDLFIIFDSDKPADDEIPSELLAIKNVVQEEISKDVGDSGTFGNQAIISFTEMSTNIGGQNDTNISLTRRMLFLLEGTWLFGEKRFEDYHKRLLNRYIQKSSPKSQVTKFLLNDIIRYYRTVATDFEYKVSEDKKPWGLRNIKLRFSRKLLYFGGLIVVAEMVGLDHKQRLDRSASLFRLPVVERIMKLGINEEETRAILSIYELFIDKISNSETRDALENTTRENRHNCDVYVDLREDSIKFSNALLKWIKANYGPSHPIHHSLIF